MPAVSVASTRYPDFLGDPGLGVKSEEAMAAVES